MIWKSEKIEDKIAYRFGDKNLLRLALTHRSYANQPDNPKQHNERLEFLGDAILDAIVADYLYENCRYLEVAKVLRLRDKVVGARTLVTFAHQLDLKEFMLLGRSEESNDFRNASKNVLGDAFEALVGAIYLDGGCERARNWLVKQFINPLLARELKNFKARPSPNLHLQFFGDIILKAVVTDFVYSQLPAADEGTLSKVREQFVSSPSLAEFQLEITPEDLSLVGWDIDKLSGLSFKAFLAEIYLALEFDETCNWWRDRLPQPTRDRSLRNL